MLAFMSEECKRNTERRVEARRSNDVKQRHFEAVGLIGTIYNQSVWIPS
ncbi:hypothetical protein K3495_g13943 [Podosphaera aphanis]|nr:hypothetical protein K3495_g13943 [Podosphaera aphanis]